MFSCYIFCRLKSNILGKSVYKYASGGTLASTLAKLGLEESTVTKSETQGDRSKCTNVGTVDHLLDEEGVYHFDFLVDGERIVAANARATLEDAVVILFLEDASPKKRGFNASPPPMEVSVALSLPNEEVDVHDMRMPATSLTKDAPQLDKGKLT